MVSVVVCLFVCVVVVVIIIIVVVHPRNLHTFAFVWWVVVGGVCGGWWLVGVQSNFRELSWGCDNRGV